MGTPGEYPRNVTFWWPKSVDFIEGVSNLVKFSYQKRLNEGRPYFHEMYGYDLVEPGGKNMVKINEEEAEVVRWIFNQFIGP